MRDSGRVSAAIEILTDFGARRVPLKTAIADWGRANRYAGAKDRAWISGLCLDVLRRRRSLDRLMGEATEEGEGENVRGVVLGALRFLWRMESDAIAALGEAEPHGPGPLSEAERACLSRPITGGDWLMDVPDWTVPMLERVFGDAALAEARALAVRADVDLRLNSLKVEPDRSLQALKSVKAKAVPILTTAARITAPDPSVRAPAVTIIPAYNKGWVEVHDLGSQIATGAAGDIKGKQVIDFCAGAGGKTLALAALMGNTGQLYAYDMDLRRLQPLYARAKRAGLRNLQIIAPVYRGAGSKETLSELVGRMDLVFVDAPCSGSGTWRRHPDTKWRLTEQQLQRRMAEQDKVLADAAPLVAPGGQLVYVTCSVFMEENEDRLAGFMQHHPEFGFVSAMEALARSGIAGPDIETLSPWVTKDGALRLSPDRCGSDGFYIAVLARAAATPGA